MLNGICVVGHVDQNFNLIRRTWGVRITGIHVSGFPGIGILGFGAGNLSVDHTRTTANGEYGITSFDSVGSRFIENEASGSEEAGLYIGDTFDSDAVLRGNNVHNNGLTGILIRNASNGLAEYNSVHDNCAGILLLAGAQLDRPAQRRVP